MAIDTPSGEIEVFEPPPAPAKPPGLPDEIKPPPITLSIEEREAIALHATDEEWQTLNLLLGNWGFRRRYANQPLKFVLECINWYGLGKPTFYQEAAINSFVHGRTAVYGPRGLGKTALDSWFVLWFALTRDGDEDWKLPTTASNWRQLNKFLWPEIRKWARRVRWDQVMRKPFDSRTEMLQMNLKLFTGEAFAAASKNSEELEGAHAQHLGYLFDEAKIIPAGHFDSIEGAFSNAGTDGNEALLLCTSTPGEPNGRFYEICSRRPGYEDWNVIRVSLDDCLKARRISPKWIEQRRLQWGEDSAAFQQHVLGRFYASASDSVIPLPWIEAAIDRWFAIEASGQMHRLILTHVGVDAGYGGDSNALAYRCGNTIRNVEAYVEANTMALVGRIKALMDKYSVFKTIVDVVGIGAGTVDRLREMGYTSRVIPFNAGTAAKDEFGDPMMDKGQLMGFANLRAASWWHLRELLDPALNYDPANQIALPPDDVLIGDLTAPSWGITSNGRIRIEDKDSIRLRLGRSTDKGDAVVQAFAQVQLDTGPLTIAYGGASGWFARD